MIDQFLRIILVGTSHPGNIGSAARAMKTMGVTKLYLVEPQCAITKESYALASGAGELLENAVITNLKTAILNCELVVGVSARTRSISLPIYEPRAASNKWIKQIKKTKAHIALVFGREDSGLSNEELYLCNQQVCIPSMPAFSSLNLAAAVQVLCYEARQAFLAQSDANQTDCMNVDTSRLVKTQSMEYFYNQLQNIMEQVEFFKHTNAEKIMTKLRSLYARAEIKEDELNILQGILTKIQQKLTSNT